MSDINLENFNGIDVKIMYEEICDEYARKCCDGVVAKSPLKSGKYKAGWITEGQKDGEEIYTAKVRNKTDWQLTHLLENGHLIVNKRNGAGWASPHAHIRPAFQEVKGKFIKSIRKAELKITEK